MNKIYRIRDTVSNIPLFLSGVKAVAGLPQGF
jgi:hypothetical protein